MTAQIVAKWPLISVDDNITKLTPSIPREIPALPMPLQTTPSRCPFLPKHLPHVFPVTWLPQSFIREHIPNPHTFSFIGHLTLLVKYGFAKHFNDILGVCFATRFGHYLPHQELNSSFFTCLNFDYDF